ncbi:hypothetical protein FACS189454_07380 [Planctomycetales bacterium]|nr:hypothetical protein FACS189454_07380 [Planctomycetales bacterium]
MRPDILTARAENAIRKAIEARKEAAELFLLARNSAPDGYLQELIELLKSVAYSSMGVVGEPITKDADKSTGRADNIAEMKYTWAAIREMAKDDPKLEQRIEDARWSSDEQRKLCLSLGYEYLETESTSETI